MRLEWDPRKNISNIKKHGISFEDSIYVFSDPNSLSIYDDYHSNSEERWITMGQVPSGKIFVVVHTYSVRNKIEIIRIISVRKATKKEMVQYYEKEKK